MVPITQPDSIAAHEKYPGVLVVQDINGARMHFLWDSGVYVPGYPYISQDPEGRHAVHLFIPYEIMTGRPRVLLVESHAAHG